MNNAETQHYVYKQQARYFELTDHLSDSRHHGGDPLPTCAPSDWSEQHLEALLNT
jgi:hypothetical protein